MERRISRAVQVGKVTIGGGAKVSVQSMTNAPASDVDATLSQISRLRSAGCDIVRVAVPNHAAARVLPDIRKGCSLPLVADIHFDHTLALAAIEAGVDKLRINPGNIGGPEKIEAVAGAAKERGIPIRVGANAGSIDRKRYGEPSAEALVSSALDQANLLERFGFQDIVVSLKAFDVPMMIEAYRLAAQKCDYPLHLGVTEAGLAWEGTIRSAVGIGALLAEGIGDTIRVSLTADPVEEIAAGAEILNSLNLREKPFTLVSCPTCGRTDIDVAGIAAKVREKLVANPPSKPITVAVMGCIVNGPGEATMADVGLAGGKGKGTIFARGEVLRTVAEADLVDELMAEVERITSDS